MSKLIVIDIGARAGLHPRWNGLPIEAIGLEADQEECDRLNAAGGDVRFLPYAVGRTDGESAVLNLTSGIGCSSLYEPNQELLAPYWHRRYWQVERQVPMTLITLDTICERHGIRPDALKLDIQGGELAALEGAEDVLKGVLAVELEVAFQETYLGQPLFADIDAFLRARGFSLTKLRTESWRRDKETKSPHGATVLYGDALYLHESRLLDAPVKANHIYRAYRLHDRTGDTVSRTWWQRVISWAMLRTDGNYKTWRTWLDACASPSMRDFRDPDL
ncbi:FkbM family methyltransferase [Steroidobacter cummioxidans]|uniref:FkbM family methyltransferase n=1 Tax=Steroidobacter cummioxidans TaxID=1803913 RepID=UPI000E316AB9|nr:FkbM family methyltransferase [Steroidobacter cummioxidans]